MTNKPKAREWKIPLGVGTYYDGNECSYAVGPIVDGVLPNPGHIVVVEKSAYEEAQKEIKRLEKELSRFEEYAPGHFTYYNPEEEKPIAHGALNQSEDE